MGLIRAPLDKTKPSRFLSSSSLLQSPVIRRIKDLLRRSMSSKHRSAPGKTHCHHRPPPMSPSYPARPFPRGSFSLLLSLAQWETTFHVHTKIATPLFDDRPLSVRSLSPPSLVTVLLFLLDSPASPSLLSDSSSQISNRRDVYHWFLEITATDRSSRRHTVECYCFYERPPRRMLAVI